MKYGLLVLLYLYFLRVMHIVWVELRPTGKLQADGPKKRKGSRSHKSHDGHSHQSSHNRSSKSSHSRAAAASAGAAAGAAAASRSGPTGGRGSAPAATSAPSAATGGSQLVVVQPPNMSGMSYPITGQELTIGRAPGCVITVDDSYVSSLHARLGRSGGQTVVEDLGSRNGTYVNDQRITQPTVLHPGDRVRVGSVVMELR